MSCHLQGQVILNTRPAHQQAELTRMLQSDGARVLSFPVIDIEPVDIGRAVSGNLSAPSRGLS